MPGSVVSTRHFFYNSMNKKAIKKMRSLIKMQFKSLIHEATRLGFFARLKLCRVILFKNEKLLTGKKQND